jgi:hypothetical protein
MFAETYGHILSGKVIIDVTNPTKGELSKLPLVVVPVHLVARDDGTLRKVGRSVTGDGVDRLTAVDCHVVINVARIKSFNGNDYNAMDYGGEVAPIRDSGAAPSSGSAAAWLSHVLPTSARVVKAINNLSAYALLHGDPLTEHMKSVVAADDADAAEAAAAFGRAMGLEVSPRQHTVEGVVSVPCHVPCSY